MSYTPTTWATGDVITAEKLNNMESGISVVNNTSVTDGSVFEISFVDQGQTVNKTETEILDAINAGKNVVLVIGGSPNFTRRIPLVSFNREKLNDEVIPSGPALPNNTLTFMGIADVLPLNGECMFVYSIIQTSDMSITGGVETISFKS